ncbi:UPF0547 protein C16orf87 homolog isoform X2 [Stylophora pistillata]|uniref:UPF0547 protein C16orf87 homolog isoform X2 n=1 Tax=Stylophora pistillata TaxID=50429 RepID=UPI000C03D070|nr:UPF0547 protein C16orf87 homolog isoform X2 [Stylophora pistillata]
MVLQQCLACNSVKTDSCTSCACGHVFEHCKLIGGKRFSEYRMELYSRLENRRVKRLTREKSKETENTKQTRHKTREATDQTSAAMHLSLKQRTKTPSQSVNRRMKTKPFPRTTGSTASKTSLPPELVSRLPNALQEINRRLTGQNLIWWTVRWLQ